KSAWLTEASPNWRSPATRTAVIAASRVFSKFIPTAPLLTLRLTHQPPPSPARARRSVEELGRPATAALPSPRRLDQITRLRDLVATGPGDPAQRGNLHH